MGLRRFGMRRCFVLLFLTALGSIAAAQPDLHVNPALRCADRIGFYESNSGFFYPVQRYERGQEVERSFSDMLEFCERVETEFSVSGLTGAEARELYGALGDDAFDDMLQVRDWQIGFPSPDGVPPPVVLEERVALSRRGPNTYGLYFWRAGCGVSHLLYRATKRPDGRLEAEREEEWIVGYPC